MCDFLDALAVTARETVNRGYYRGDYIRKLSPVSLKQGIIHKAGNAVISEIKPASPSLGEIRSDIDPAKVACQMEAGGAAGISVLTEPTHFKGSLENLMIVREAVKLPVLMKDFIICIEQINTAYNIGADAILLIQALFDREYCEASVDQMITEAHSLGLEVLLEAHNVKEFRKAVKTKADLIGINNRNLKTLSVDTRVTHRILESCKILEKTLISESGINTVGDIRSLCDIGSKGFLIGSSIMLSDDIENAVREFVQA